uniref:YfhO family protein n=1 Tax=Burkholderia sp. (strain CCGE1003) TaxID=640512 RepID=E1TAA5_BURSG
MWRIQRTDAVPLLLLFLLPVIAALPGLAGLYDPNPMLYLGMVAKHYKPGLTQGFPYVDPNNAFTAQALGYRAALDWLNGTVPWWNHFSGVGLPLAAEYQPAVFFPPTLMLLLPNGMLLQHVVLQIIAGWGAYGLLRQLGLRRFAASTGGMLFAFTGALAWFDHAPALPVPFLPWMLWGVERAFTKAERGMPRGWRLFAVALWMSLVAGFPETAYLNSLLAFVWALLRFCQAHAFRLAFAVRLAIGGVVGLALSAPQVLAFFEFLPHAWLGGHDGGFAHAALDPAAVLPSLLFPYVYGPIASGAAAWDRLGTIWGGIGGYLSIIVVVVGMYGVLLRRTPITWLLLAWLFMALGKSFGVPVVTTLWNLVPGIAQAAFYRYAVPSWELAVIVLAAEALDELRAQQHETAKYRRHVAILAALVLLAGVVYTASLWHHLRDFVPVRNAALASIAWGLFSIGAFVALLFRCRPPKAATAIAALLIVDSVLMFTVPTLSNPRSGDVDMEAIGFLQKNVGLQRIYSLGPIQANYGAYFGIAAINHNYLPINRRWVDWIRANLDAYADPIAFIGNYRTAGSTVPTSTQELVRNLQNYEWIGVKYVITRAGDDPFVSTLASKTDATPQSALPLMTGDTLSGRLAPGLTDKPVTIDHIGVLIGNYGNTSEGIVTSEVCVDSLCTSGQRDLKGSSDNSMFYVPLARALPVETRSVVTYRFTLSGGSKPLALWMTTVHEPADDQQLHWPGGALRGRALQVKLLIRDDKPSLAKQVYADQVMDIYELGQPKPYFEELDQACQITSQDRAHVTTDCSVPSTLLRRELFFPGWTAKVNGSVTPISEHKGLFQTIDLPAGKSSIVLSYEPPHMIWAWIAMVIGFGMLLAPAVKKKSQQRKR